MEIKDARGVVIQDGDCMVYQPRASTLSPPCEWWRLTFNRKTNELVWVYEDEVGIAPGSHTYSFTEEGTDWIRRKGFVVIPRNLIHDKKLIAGFIKMGGFGGNSVAVE